MSRAGFDEQGRSMSIAVEGVSPTEFMGVKIVDTREDIPWGYEL